MPKLFKPFQTVRKHKWRTLLLGLCLTLPIIAAACGPNDPNQTSLDQLVSKGDGTQFASNYSLEQGVQDALKTRDGIIRYQEQVYAEALLNFYERLANENPADASQKSVRFFTYQQFLETQREQALQDYNDQFAEFNRNFSNDAALKFQTEVLDLHGGNMFAFLKEKLLNAILNRFSEDLFNQFYLAVVDGNNQPVLNTANNLLKALKQEEQFRFGFVPNVLTNTNPDPFVDKLFSDFQNYLYEQWAISEFPLIFNQVQWTYDAPTTRVDEVYTSAALNKTASNNAVSASYQFPLFNNQNSDNNTISTIGKYLAFVQDVTNNAIVDAATGLKEINSQYNTTTSDSTFVFSTVQGLFTNQSPAFGLAALQLLSNVQSSSVSGVNNPPAFNLHKALVTNNNTKQATSEQMALGLDLLTQNFVTTDLKNFQNQTNDSMPETASNNNQANKLPIINLQIDKATANRIFQANVTQDLYVIDAFIPTNQNLNQFLFFRDATGVKALTLDGYDYLKKATNFTDLKQKAAAIATYRYLQNQANSNQGVAFDLKAQLKNFFDQNRAWLITHFVDQYQTTDNQIFDLNFLTNEIRNLLVAFSNYDFAIRKQNLAVSAQSAASANKMAFNSNLGADDVIKNGLATLYPYRLVTNPNLTFPYYFQIRNLFIFNNWFGKWNLSAGNMNQNPIDVFVPNGLYETYLKAVETVFNIISINPLTDGNNFSGFRFSQYVYTDNYFWNQALLAAFGNGTAFALKLKQNALLDALNNSGDNGFKITKNSLKPGFFTWENSANNDLNNAVTNLLISEVFNQASPKFLHLHNLLTPLQNSLPKPATSNPAAVTTDGAMAITNQPQTALNTFTVSPQEFAKYLNAVWNRTHQQVNQTSFDAHEKLSNLLFTINALMQDDYKLFLEEVQNVILADNFNYLVFEKAINTNFNAALKDLKSYEYLNNQTSLPINVNHNLSSSYYPNVLQIAKPTQPSESLANSDSNLITTFPLANNTAHTLFSISNHYYQTAANSSSYIGLVNNQENNSVVSNAFKNLIFDQPYLNNSENVGLLYDFASDLNALKERINGLTLIGQVDQLAMQLENLFPNINQFHTIQNINDLAQKKAALITILDQMATNGTNPFAKAFNPRFGYLGKSATDFSLYTNPNVVNNQIAYAALVFQVRKDDFNSWTAINEHLTKGFMAAQMQIAQDQKMLMPTAVSQNNFDAKQAAHSLLTNLLVQFAMKNEVQEKVINNFFNANQITVFDVRFNNTLGANVVKDFKNNN